MINIPEPEVWFRGDLRHPPQWASKIAMDWSSKKIRLSLELKREHNFINVRKEVQHEVIHVMFDDDRIELR